MPLYVVAVLFSALIDIAFHLERVTLKGVIAHLFMLQNFTPKYVLGLNGPLWTMPVDFEFYFALPIAATLAFDACGRIDRRARPRIFVGILLATAIVSFAYRLAVQHVAHEFSMTITYFILMSNVFGMAIVFCCGIALAYVSERRGMRPLGSTVAVISIAVAVVFFIAAMQTTVVPLALDTILAAFSVTALLVALPTFGLVRRLARSRGVGIAASLAYAIYLFHLPVLRVVSTRLGTPTGNVAFVEVTVISAIALFPIVYIAHRFVERPFLAIKDRKREARI